VDPVPDPLLLRPGSTENGTRTSGSSSTSGGRSVGIVHSRTQAMELLSPFRMPSQNDTFSLTLEASHILFTRKTHRSSYYLYNPS
jgi:hypothetical protein